MLAIAVSYLRRDTALVPPKLVRALAEGTTGVLSIAATCATAGIIVGVTTLTGLAQRFADIIIGYAQGNLVLTALFSAAIVWVVGLAVPVTASYIMCAVIAAPALIKLGVPDFAAHMFIFYYAVLSEVSPPTALSPFAAAAITGGSPYLTTMQAWKYTHAGIPGAVRVRVRSARASACCCRFRRAAAGSISWSVTLETLAGIAILAFAFQGRFLQQEHGPGDGPFHAWRHAAGFPRADRRYHGAGRVKLVYPHVIALALAGARHADAVDAAGAQRSRAVAHKQWSSSHAARQDIAAVVTGGASGLGAATARALAAKGVKVALLDLNADAGEKLAKELGGIFAKCDVTNEASVDAALAAARKAHGQERILVNCAGIGVAKRISRRVKETNAIEPHDLATFAKVIQVNLIGTFLMMSKSAIGMQATQPVNKDGERGVMICTSSVAAQDGQIGQVAYSASKGGVASMTLPVARDLRATASASSPSCPACS